MKCRFKSMLSLLLSIALLSGVFCFDSVTVEAKNAIKTRAEATSWLNAQEGATYNFNGANGTQCVEFVKAYVNWLVNGNAWSDCWASTGWGGSTGDGHTIWQNPIWNEFGWKVYPNTADFVPQPGDIFSAGKGTYSHTGVVISSTASTARIAESNGRDTIWENGDSVWVHDITWGPFGADHYHSPNYFIRPYFADTPSLVTPSITFDKNSYMLGDTVTVSWTPSPATSNLSHYWITVFNPDGVSYIGERINKSVTSYSFTPPGAGTHSVKLMATPIGSVSGEGSLIDTKSFVVVNDVDAPSIRNIEVSDVSATGYTITCEVSDMSGVSQVAFPTWTEKNGQDDLLWKDGTITGSTVTFRVDAAEHNNEEGKYITHIYATDIYGNKTEGHPVYAIVDRTSPTIESVEVYDVDETGYSIKVTASDNYGVTRVACPTWSEANYQDDLLWKDAVLEGNTAYFRVNTADHNNELGTYVTDVYVYDAAGNRKTSNWIWTHVTAMASPTKMVSRNGHTYTFYEVYRSWGAAKALCEQLGGHLATITSAEEQEFLRNHADGKAFWIGAVDQYSDNQWQWVTDEMWGYTAWADNQATDTKYPERYAYLTTSGEWNNTCMEMNAEKIGFIVEVDPDITSSEIGDVNMDGTNNMRDALMLYQAVSGKATLDITQQTLADINGDGTVNMRDALMLYQQISG